MEDQNAESNVSKEKADADAIPKRRQNRIAAMQFLYAWSLSSTHGELGDELREFFEKAATEKEEKPEFAFADVSELGHPREFYAFAEELIAGTLENLQRIDETISDAAKNWSLDRIARCDLAILRLAIYELFFRKDIPPVVSINEAIDLAKIYSTEESHKFVNGVLDTVKKCLSRPLRTPQR